jgi:hypothetical protein
MSLIFTQFTHVNIKMSLKVDQLLSCFIVSLEMPKVDYYNRLPYTDSSCSNIFSIWDLLFGIYLEFDREKIVYGVDRFPDKIKNSSLKALLKQPFQGARKPTNVEEFSF